jgi:hypothetical protein
MNRLGLVPNFWVEKPTAGETKSAIDIERPPIRAYSSWVAAGNVECERK